MREKVASWSKALFFRQIYCHSRKMAALGLAPGPTMPPLPLQIRVEGRGPGEEAGGGPYLLFTIRMCAAATRPAGAALCASLPRNVCRQVGSGRGASF